MNEQDIAQQDLADDFEELIYLLDNNLGNLHRFYSDIKKVRKYIIGESYKLIINNLERSIYKNTAYKNGIIKIKRQIGAENNEKIRAEKHQYQDLVRIITKLSAALITATDWQSPSFDFSLSPAAGRQTGKISGTVNDYKRDVHLDEKYYEEAYVREYIDAKYKFFLKAYLTNSGQAAFQTILTYLSSENKIAGKVMVGRSSYFQYKQILKGIFGWKTILIPEMNNKVIMERIRKEKPGVIFIDSLTNSAEIAVPDLNSILDYIYRTAEKDIYIIIDNTCLAVSCQPFLLRKTNKKVHLITFESLNKYYQFGLDLVTAGVIICDNREAGGIFEYRKHAGTNISDTSVYALPKPNRKLLKKRLNKHQRNAQELAKYLSETDRQGDKIEKIIYPGLDNHPAYDWSKELEFKGSFLNIKFKEQYDNPKYMKKLMDLVIKTGRQKEVNIIGGTSFGLNTTRIYLTSLLTKFGKPFLRVSLGTEDYLTLTKIKAVFGKVIEKF